MRTLQEIMKDVVARPWDDEPRLEYAAALQAKDPAFAELIRAGVRREGCDSATYNRISVAISEHCEPGLSDRGFLEQLNIEPYYFIEHGERLLNQWPVRHINFVPIIRPKDWEPAHPYPSPIEELVHCPTLRRLRSISFTRSKYHSWVLQERDLELLAECPYIDNLLWLEMSTVQGNRPADEFWRRLYTAPRWRSLLHFQFEWCDLFDREDWTPAERPWQLKTHVNLPEGSLYTVSPLSAIAQELEAKYGYIPSLHYLENQYDMFPTTRRFETGLAPRFPVGAALEPAMAETPAPVLYPPIREW